MNDLLQEHIAGWLRRLNLPDPEIDYDADGTRLDIAYPDDQLGLRIDEHQEEVSWNGWTIWLCQYIDQAFDALSEIASRLGISPNYQVVDLSRIEAIFAQGLFDSALTEIDALQLPESHPQYDDLNKLKTKIRNEKRRAGRGQSRQQVNTSSFVEKLRRVPSLREAQLPDHNFFGFYDSQPNMPEGIDAVWIASYRQGAIDVWAAAAAGRPALASDPDFVQESTEVDLLRHTIEKLDGATTFIWDSAEVIPLLRTWHYRDNGSDLPSSYVFVDLRAICLVAFPQAKRTDSPESLCQELKLEFSEASGQGSPLAAMLVLLSTCIEQFQSFDAKLQGALRKVLNGTSLRGEWLDQMLTADNSDTPLDEYIKYLIAHYESLPAPIQRSDGERHAHGLTVDDFLQNNGFLAQVQGEQYRVRSSQVGFAKRIAEALHSPQPYLLEAGTGVGKTIGYVIPLLLRGKRAYVATHTKNLQDQAWVKDIPTALKTFGHAGIGRSVSILKGKSNYFSPQALESALADLGSVIGTSESQAFTFAALLHWAVTTSTGFLSELEGAGNPELIGYFSREKTSPAGNGTWAQIDPYRRALEASQNADLVLVNQSLIFALAKLEQPQLGEVDIVVFDEAHNLEDVATDALTLNFDAWSIQAEIRSLLGRDSKGRVRGLLGSIIEPRNIKQDSVLQEFRKFISDVEAVFDTWCQVCSNRLEEIRKFRTELDEETPMLFEFSEFWQDEFQQRAIELSQKLERLISILKPLIEILPGLHGIPHSLTNRIQSALSSLLEHITDGDEALRALLADDSEWIRWGEANIIRTDNEHPPLFAEPLALQSVLHCTPLDVSSWLKTTLPNLYAHRIYVSATLAVGSDFSSISRRLGLMDEAPTTDVFPSPYNLREQALLAVPTDIPSPQSGTDSLYIEALSRNIAEFVKLSKGHALVLFTSRRTMNEVVPRLQALLSETGIIVLAQNAHNRSAIAERFRLAPIEGENLVLLGLKAFWEGVDFPGALKLLIITRLPFDFTGHPVAAAKRIHWLICGIVNKAK